MSIRRRARIPRRAGRRLERRLGRRLVRQRLGFDFTRPTPDYDLGKLAAYAKSKGVHLIGHDETGCAVSHFERQVPKAFALYEKLGIDAVKTGYVCDAGQVERQDAPGGEVAREWHDGQWMSRHHLYVVEQAARHHIAIDAHEPIKDTGLRRTYPNWVSREGARHGIQRLGRSAQPAGARGQPGVHPPAVRADGFHPRRVEA